MLTGYVLAFDQFKVITFSGIEGNCFKALKKFNSQNGGYQIFYLNTVFAENIIGWDQRFWDENKIPNY